jgi:hypothetical protein
MYFIAFYIINSDFVLIKSTILDLFGKSNVLLCLEYINLNLPLSPVLTLYIPLRLQFYGKKISFYQTQTSDKRKKLDGSSKNLEQHAIPRKQQLTMPYLLAIGSHFSISIHK